MHTRTITKKLEIAYVIKDKWHFPIHKHTYYELQYIIKGKGQHVINDNIFNYEKGDIFITPPGIPHFFIFQESTVICIIKFNKTFFGDFLKSKDMEKLLSNVNFSSKKVFLSSSCRKNIDELIHLIIKAYKKETSYQEIIIKNALSLVFALVGEDSKIVLNKPGDEKVQAILQYIHDHIQEKKLLLIANISKSFNINQTYFNQYFKRATGSSYKKYVQEYILNKVAQQLIYHGKTLSQLSFEFGFSDESHLSRAFKAYFKQTPSSFKKHQSKQSA
jgi:AraC-like DNA-binding protein